MTGYGRADFCAKTSGVEESFSLEIKTLNHRHLDIKVRAPQRFLRFEAELRGELKKKFSRGSVSVFINFVGSSGGESLLNTNLIESYLKGAKELREKFSLKGEPSVEFVLGLSNIFGGTATDSDAGEEETLKSLIEAVRVASEETLNMRTREGVALKADLLEKLETVGALLTSVEKKIPEVVEQYQGRLEKSIEKYRDAIVAHLDELRSGEGVLSSVGFDEERLVTEAAIFADKTNIAEEVTRFFIHINEAKKYLETDEPVGRRLDFLCQELLREANTVSSKTPDAEVTQLVVEIKGELEKVREQVQNIE